MNFPFPMDSLNPPPVPPPLPPHLLNGHNQNPLSMAKVFVGAPPGGGRGVMKNQYRGEDYLKRAGGSLDSLPI